VKEEKQSKAKGSAKDDSAQNANVSRRRPLTRAEGKASRRVDALFKTLSTDYLLREQFVTDPAQVMSEYVSGDRLPEAASDAANQLLYSVMSNPRLRDWVSRYASHLGGTTPSRHAFAVELARAIASRGDELAALALVRAATAGPGHFAVQADLLRGFITVIGGRVGSSGTEMSPGGGTEMSPGGTEMSPGAIFSGTEMSPGGGTEMSPGGTEMSPGAIFSGTEMSPGGGTEMSPGGTEMSPGAIFSGTEMSPGGGTEMSPGGTEMSPGAIFSGTEMSPGGTEMSPGALTAGRLPGYLQVTLNALTQYASQLRARGALFTTGLESR
jgi:hypothetical protein